MVDSTSEPTLPRPNVYGVLVVVSALAGVGVLTAGAPSTLGYGLLAFAVALIGVAMWRDTGDDGPESVDNDDGTNETAQKAKTETDSAGGWF